MAIRRLLIGAVNLVNLLLIRASARARELSIRQALRAGRRHVLRQVATENVLLSLAAHVAADGRLAVAALAGAGLLGVSLRQAMAVPPGFRPDHVMTGQVSLPATATT